MKKRFTLAAAFMVTTTLATDAIDLSIIKRFLSPTDKITDVKESIVPGVYEVVLNNRVLYVSADGKKIINGDIYDVEKKINYTEERNKALRLSAVNQVADNDKIIYKATNEKYKVTVFTDISCGYCRQLHSQMKDYNNKGITIEYLAFPRAGLNTETAKAMQKIWCSEDKTLAMTEAKINNKTPKKSCQGDQVKAQFMLGRDLGINGTPAMIFPNGELGPGYLTPDQLLSALKMITK